MAKRAAGPNTPRARLLAAVRPVADQKPRAGVTADSSVNRIAVARMPGKTAARNARRDRRASPDVAVDGRIEDPRRDSVALPPHPAAIRREDVPLAERR